MLNVKDVVSPFAYDVARIFGYTVFAVAWWYILQLIGSRIVKFSERLAELRRDNPADLKQAPIATGQLYARDFNASREPELMPIPIMSHGRVAKVYEFRARTAVRR